MIAGDRRSASRSRLSVMASTWAAVVFADTSTSSSRQVSPRQRYTLRRGVIQQHAARPAARRASRRSPRPRRADPHVTWTSTRGSGSTIRRHSPADAATATGSSAGMQVVERVDDGLGRLVLRLQREVELAQILLVERPLVDPIEPHGLAHAQRDRRDLRQPGRATEAGPLRDRDVGDARGGRTRPAAGRWPGGPRRAREPGRSGPPTRPGCRRPRPRWCTAASRRYASRRSSSLGT